MSTLAAPSIMNQAPIPLQPRPTTVGPNTGVQNMPQNPPHQNSTVAISTNVAAPMSIGPVASGIAPQTSWGTTTTIPNRRRITRREADLQPWRYLGYPAMSSFVASDDDLFVLRRFQKLGARVALMMQANIAQLEEDLMKEDDLGKDEKQHCGTFLHDPRAKRVGIMEEIKSRLTEYQRFILDHSTLKARPDANEFQIQNVKTWMDNNKGSITAREAKFINREGDLMPMVPKVKSPLRRFIDRYQLFRRIGCFRERKLNSRHYGHDDLESFESQTTVYNSDTLMEKISTGITIVLGLAMLIGPLWLLQHFSTDTVRSNLRIRLIIITFFLIGFAGLLTIITVARPFETLAATAAYGAVLMVFMQLNSGPSN